LRELIRRAAGNHFHLSFYGWGWGFAAAGANYLLDANFPAIFCSGKPFVCPLLNCAQYMPNSYWPACHLILGRGSNRAAKSGRRQLLSFQCGSLQIFPQTRGSSSHLGTRARPGFVCRSLQRLSQPATPCAVLNHFEIGKLSLKGQLRGPPGAEPNSFSVEPR
jgi:hypothetical protein